MDATTSSVPVADPVTVEKRVGQYVQVRDMISAIQDRHKAELQKLVDVQNKLTAWMLEHLSTTGAQSVKTKAGTCYASTRYSATLADADAFMKFVIANQQFELMDRRANSTAVKDYAEEHGGALPPGVNLSALRTLGVRRAPNKSSKPDVVDDLSA